jgi:serine/threonine protein kinase
LTYDGHSVPETRHESTTLNAGDKLGAYEIIQPLGVGGMAEVFVARGSTGLEGVDRCVALKRILPALESDQDFIDMFRDEARVAATLSHPNIATLYEFGSDGGRYFFSMEYVHGQNLRHVLKKAAKNKRGLKLAHALTIVAGVLAGLHHAHEQRGPDGNALGIVHRDASPNNILVGYDGQIKLVDFGIARAARRVSTTREGVFKGNIGYLSPEQCQRSEVDRRSDVFVLGIVLYELTTGKRLFAQKSEMVVLHELVYEDIPPPSSVRHGYPEELDRIVIKALARDPDDRFATAQEFQVALEDFAREQKLSLSTVHLARFMLELFGEVPDPSHLMASTERSGERAVLDQHTKATRIDSVKTGGSTKSSLSSSIAGASKRSSPWALAAVGIALLALSVAIVTPMLNDTTSSTPTSAADNASTPAVSMATPPETPKPEVTTAAPTALPVASASAAAETTVKPSPQPPALTGRLPKKPAATAAPAVSASAAPKPLDSSGLWQ